MEAFTSELFWETCRFARSLHIASISDGHVSSRLTCHPEAGEARRRTSQMQWDGVRVDQVTTLDPRPVPSLGDSSVVGNSDLRILLDANFNPYDGDEIEVNQQMLLRTGTTAVSFNTLSTTANVSPGTMRRARWLIGGMMLSCSAEIFP